MAVRDGCVDVSVVLKGLFQPEALNKAKANLVVATKMTITERTEAKEQGSMSAGGK